MKKGKINEVKKTYYISVDLDVAGIEAKNEEEALKEANEYIKSGAYSLNIVDVDG